MAIIQLVAGAQSAYAAAFAAADVNSLASGSFALSTTIIAQSTNLDLWAQLSVSLTGTTAATGAPDFSIYVMPLNGDGTTYGDGTASGTVNPGYTYLVGKISVPNSKTSVALVGSLFPIYLPRANFKFGIVNNTGNALSASGNSVWYNTTNQSVV